MQRVLCLAIVWIIVTAAHGQEGRKIVSKIMPVYPPLAHVVHLSGAVKLSVRVDSNGRVESVEVRGGNPVLAQAAVAAVSKWKWEPSAEPTGENLEIKFMPETH